MSSVTKTLELLDYFTPLQPEIGLSQLCRLAGWDKATTYRRLQSLEEAGFVEQNRITKRYRLGPALLQLAHTREITVPRKAGAEAQVRHLAEATGETSHISVMSGKNLFALMAVESPKHSIRVVIDIQVFPLHATASGLCALAFGLEDLHHAAQGSLTPYTAKTITSPEQLQACIKNTRSTGFGKAEGSFEADVISLAVPVFDQTGFFAGAVSVATVATRFTDELESVIKTHLVTASREITHNWGGIVPAHIEKAWHKTLSPSLELESSQ